jgi:[protein-PII] uridylyltransferase
VRRGLANPIDKEELILETQAQAEQLLAQTGLKPERWRQVWTNFTEEYYLRHRPVEIAWHTSVLASEANSQNFLVDVSNSIADGLTVLMVYTKRELKTFVRTTAALDGLGLNIVDARILPLSDDHNLDTYCVLESDGSPITDRQRLEEVRYRLLDALTNHDPRSLKVTRRTPRQVRMFSTPVQVVLSLDPVNHRTVIELVASDRPGLLFQVGQIFERFRVLLTNAKVLTIGERVEDVFFVTTEANQPLSAELGEQLRASMEEGLGESRA